jgi:hypothetical protein
MSDPDDDARDGILFRFWIRAGSYPEGWPGRLAELFREESARDGRVTPASYRRALMRLSDEKGVNLP